MCCVTLESKLSSALTACPSSTSMSTRLLLVVSELMSNSTRMTSCRMENSDTMSVWPFTNVMNRSRARLLHWFPRMMDWAEGRIPITWNSWALYQAQDFVLYFTHFKKTFLHSVWPIMVLLPGTGQTEAQRGGLLGYCRQQQLCCQSPRRTPTTQKTKMLM